MEIQPRSDDALEVGVRLKMAKVTSLDCQDYSSITSMKGIMEHLARFQSDIFDLEARKNIKT